MIQSGGFIISGSRENFFVDLRLHVGLGERQLYVLPILKYKDPFSGLYSYKEEYDGGRFYPIQICVD